MALIQQRFKDHEQLSIHSLLLVLTLLPITKKENKKADTGPNTAHMSMPLLNQIVYQNEHKQTKTKKIKIKDSDTLINTNHQ